MLIDAAAFVLLFNLSISTKRFNTELVIHSTFRSVFKNLSSFCYFFLLFTEILISRRREKSLPIDLQFVESSHHQYL